MADVKSIYKEGGLLWIFVLLVSELCYQFTFPIFVNGNYIYLYTIFLGCRGKKIKYFVVNKWNYVKLFSIWKQFIGYLK